ncbi:MAG: hypothetical protein ACYC3A_05545 [Halothiobacillus sp.]
MTDAISKFVEVPAFTSARLTMNDQEIKDVIIMRFQSLWLPEVPPYGQG